MYNVGIVVGIRRSTAGGLLMRETPNREFVSAASAPAEKDKASADPSMAGASESTPADPNQEPGDGSRTGAARDILATPRVSDAKLQNIINDLYKGTTNLGRVGNGTTAVAVRQELATGRSVGGRFQLQKANDYARGLENWLRNNPNDPYQDRLVAQSVLDDLRSALGGAHERRHHISESHGRSI